MIAAPSALSSLGWSLEIPTPMPIAREYAGGDRRFPERRRRLARREGSRRNPRRASPRRPLGTRLALPPRHFGALLTLFSKSFSPFPCGTWFSIGVAAIFSLRGRIYPRLRGALSNAPTRTKGEPTGRRFERRTETVAPFGVRVPRTPASKPLRPFSLRKITIRSPGEPEPD
jgi:hypothetical protein